VFGSLGGPEIVFIFVLALLLFGPRKLPEIGRTFGRTLAELRKATHEFRSTLEREIDVERLSAARPAPGSTPGTPANTAHEAVPRRPASPPREGPSVPSEDEPPPETAGTDPRS
jgi:TatA/E family protein of Tat protein translocase